MAAETAHDIDLKAQAQPPARDGGPAPPEIVRFERGTERAAWDAFVDRHPQGTAWHRGAWLDIVEAVSGHECQRWVARDGGGRIRGVLPIVRLRSRLFGDFGVSVPFVNYGGALADTAAVRSALMVAAGDHAASAGMRHIEFRDRTPLAGEWPVRRDKILLSRPLPGETGALWNELPGKLRTQIRRPRKESGVTVRVGRLDLLADFYHVFARNMRDLGTPVHGTGLFRALLERCPQSFIVAVHHAGRPVAAGFLHGDRDRLEIPWASSLREYNRWGVNMLLYWRCLEVAVERGYREFDFGRSSAGSGTCRFKEQWGARPVQCHWHYWLAPGRAIPALTPDNPKYRFAIGAWRRLPVAVANGLGPHIVKNLP